MTIIVTTRKGTFIPILKKVPIFLDKRIVKMLNLRVLEGDLRRVKYKIGINIPLFIFYSFFVIIYIIKIFRIGIQYGL